MIQLNNPQDNQCSNQQEIRHVAQLKNFIKQNLSHELNPHKFQKQLNDQIVKNYNRYKKQTLQKERVNLTLQQNHKIQELNKKRIKEFLEQKAESVEKKKKEKLKILSQKKHIQRLIKQSMNKNRRQVLENQKVQKTLKTIQNLQKKQILTKLPIRLRMIEAQTSSSTNPQPLQQLKLLQRYIKGRKQKPSSQMSSYSQQSRGNYPSQIEQQNNTLLITALRQSSHNRQKSISNSNLKSKYNYSNNSNHSNHSLLPITVIQKGLTKKSKSLNNLRPIELKNQGSSKKGQLLKRIIEQRNSQLYNKYLDKKTIAYNAKNMSYHQEIKQIIQKYLRKHIKKLT